MILGKWILVFPVFISSFICLVTYLIVSGLLLGLPLLNIIFGIYFGIIFNLLYRVILWSTLTFITKLWWYWSLPRVHKSTTALKLLLLGVINNYFLLAIFGTFGIGIRVFFALLPLLINKIIRSEVIVLVFKVIHHFLSLR